MKTQKIVSLIIAGAFLSVGIVGCKKEVSTFTSSKDNDVTAASDNSSADAAFNDVQNITDQAASGVLTFYSATYSGDNSHTDATTEKSSCAVITHDTISVPHLLTIDFGTTNCLCNDGKNRRGQINVSYTGRYKDDGSVHSITFTNYFINDNQLLGTKTVTNNGHNASGNLSFTVVVDGQMIKADGTTHSWNSTRVREMLEGESTPEWLDDVYSITGSSSGTACNGNTYTSVITTPLHRALNCHWFDSGVVEVTPSSKPVRIINYGGGSCDSDATVTISGTSHSITLH